MPSIRGSSQLPSPPINTGITKKKIIKKSCAVTITLDGGSKSVYGRGTF